MSDETPETPVDAGAVLCNALVVLTGVMLIGAVWVVLVILRDQYGRGMLA